MGLEFLESLAGRFNTSLSFKEVYGCGMVQEMQVAQNGRRKDMRET